MGTEGLSRGLICERRRDYTLPGACWVNKSWKVGTGHLALQRARKRRQGRFKGKAPSHSRDADPL